jgi:hypothetical protein
MDIQKVPFSVIYWTQVAGVEHKGEAGTSRWRTVEEGNIRVRKVEYSAGFVSDHWCPRGHVGLVLKGELMIELKDGRRFVLGPGMSFLVSDDEANPHRVSTSKKTVLFLVD